eukprot:908817-Rhodomonas_salina.1
MPRYLASARGRVTNEFLVVESQLLSLPNITAAVTVRYSWCIFSRHSQALSPKKAQALTSLEPRVGGRGGEGRRVRPGDDLEDASELVPQYAPSVLRIAQLRRESHQLVAYAAPVLVVAKYASLVPGIAYRAHGKYQAGSTTSGRWYRDACRRGAR